MKAFFARLGDYFLTRLTEKSTYAGLSVMAIAMHRQIPADWLTVIEWYGPFLAGGLMAASEGK